MTEMCMLGLLWVYLAVGAVAWLLAFFITDTSLTFLKIIWSLIVVAVGWPVVLVYQLGKVLQEISKA